MLRAPDELVEHAGNFFDREYSKVFLATSMGLGSFLLNANSILTFLLLVGSVIVTWRKVFGKGPKRPRADEDNE